MNFLAALTDDQTTHVLRMINQIVDLLVSVVTISLPVLLLYFQRKNKKDITEKVDAVEKKVDENTAVSQTAFDVANGHNAKIAQLTQQIADSK